MANSYTGGSVKAEIILDTTNFNFAIDSLKTKVSELKTELGNGNFKDLSSQVKDYKAQLKKCRATIDELTASNSKYKKQIKSLRDDNKNAEKSFKNLADFFKKTTESSNKLGGNFARINAALTTLADGAKIKFGQITNEIKKAEVESRKLKNNLATNNKMGSLFTQMEGRSRYADFNPYTKWINQGKIGIGTIKRQFATVSETYAREYEKANSAIKSAVEKYKANFQSLGTGMAGYNNYVNKFRQSQTAANQSIQRHNEMIKKSEAHYNSLKANLPEVFHLYDKMGNVIGRSVDVLKNFNFQLIEQDKTMSRTGAVYGQFTERVTALSSAMHRLSVQGSSVGDYEGRQKVGGYSNYISQIAQIESKLPENIAKMEAYRQKLDEANTAIKRLAESHRAFQNQGNRGEPFLRNVTTLNNRIRTLSSSINTFSNQSNQNRIRLTNEARAVRSLELQLKNLSTWYKTGKIDVTQYKEGITRLEAELSKLQSKFSSTKASIEKNNASYSKANAEIRNLSNQYRANSQASTQMGAGARTAGNSMQQTAHSGRILSNTLYQIRGALLSLKMIFTAMGGMALWGFATNIAEGVKETFKAKNEMEAQLRQNSKVGEGGIAYFNQQLDAMTDKFRKVNKYSIGETVSSIGLEFDLSAKQMAESLDIVSMVQSEYVRAGRKEAEAALAVKDILQGEFSRLSRETGVGREELEQYGWSGDKSDVTGLMKALRKAATDRHWDIFAAKATSLNDVMTILKSRFSETGADIAQSVTPLVVGAFNALIGATEKLHNAFNGLNTFWQNFTLFGGSTAAVFSIGTALPMIAKGFGLADIATIGWGKSLAAAALNLNKAEVAQYGFRKALAATIAGTKASELENVRSTKAIMGRILGVRQSTLAEKGYLTALVQSKAELVGGYKKATALAEASTLSTAQKLAYLTNNFDIAKAKSMSTSQALLRTAFSAKVLRAALLGITAVIAISWLASVASWADTIKKNVDGFNDVAENGKSILEDAKNTTNGYEKALGKLTKGTKEYTKAANNLKQAKLNEKDIETANKLAKQYKKQNEETEKEIKLRHQLGLAQSYELAGLDTTKASEQASGYTAKVKAGQEAIAKSWEVYDDRLYKSSQHINEHVSQLEQAGASSEEMVKYVSEYNLEAENAANLWKKFNQGDMNSGVYALLSELKLAWIDISHHPEVVKLFKNLQDTFESWKPTLKEVSKFLSDVGLKLVDIANAFFSSDIGKQTALWGVFGSVAFIVGKKLYNVLGGTKSTIDILKTLGGFIKDRIKDWKDYGDELEKVKEKTGGSKSTGGINDKGGITDLKATIGEDFKQNARNFVKYATQIAMAMTLVTEAILLLNMPMGALAATGVTFSALEPHIRKGIDGLKLIAPTVTALLVPTIALMVIMSKFGIKTSTLYEGFVDAALGIAMGITLVTEAMLLLNMPLIALGSLGAMYSAIKPSVDSGIKAMDILNQSLMALVPWIPVLAAGIALAAVTIGTGGVGGIAIAAAAVGIAIGIEMVAGTILLLNAPLWAIGNLGNNFQDLSNVEQGARAIELTAQALKSLEVAFGALAGIGWDQLQMNIQKLLGVNITADLSQMTQEGGLLTNLDNFTKGFNTLTITPIDSAKVDALNTAATSISTISTALSNVKTAMDTIPAEFKQAQEQLTMQYDAKTDTTNVNVVEGQNYFSQLQEPIDQLNEFITQFNTLNITPPAPEKVEAINQSASFISQVKDAITNIQNALQSVGQAQLTAASVSGGGFGSAITAAFGNFGASSGLKGGLDEIYNSIKDIMDFNTNINTLMGGEGLGDTSGITGATSLVSGLQTQLNSLKTTLETSVPTIKDAAKNVGTGIVTGVKDGVANLGSEVGGAIEAASGNIAGKGWDLGNAVKEKFKEGIDPMSDVINAELDYIGQELENRKGDLGDKAYALGAHIAAKFKEGEDSHSPGIMARTIFAEVDYMEGSLDNAITTLPQKTYSLAQSMVSQFSPSFDMALPQISDLTSFTSGLQTISSTANQTNAVTSNAFTNMNMTVGQNMTGMTNSVNGSFSNIKTNATNSYNQIVTTTRTSLTNMQSQTTKNIGAIRASWTGMQKALIASAEHIRSQTGAKIKSLQNNMASFWQKVQNPALLMSGAAGGEYKGTIRRRSPPPVKSSNGGKLINRFAFGGFKTGSKQTGISSKIKASKPKTPSLDVFSELVNCLRNGGNCAFGGGNSWNFDWAKDIQDALMKWHTHFGDIYDPYLYVGKFENDDFPVRGNAEIFKRYVFDAISRTQYSLYSDSRFGDDPVAAYNSGHFNCWDGANIVMALANAFGFSSHRVWGSWNGIPHVWAYVDGVGAIDATAIQNRGSLFAPSAVGAAGGTTNRNAMKRFVGDNAGETHNYNGDVNVEVHVHGNDVEVGNQKLDKQSSRQLMNILGINPATGR